MADHWLYRFLLGVAEQADVAKESLAIADSHPPGSWALPVPAGVKSAGDPTGMGYNPRVSEDIRSSRRHILVVKLTELPASTTAARHQNKHACRISADRSWETMMLIELMYKSPDLPLW